MRAVNLLPRDTRPSRLGKKTVPIVVGACAALLVTAMLGATFMIQSGKVAKAQRNLDELTRQYDALPPAPAGPSSGEQQLVSEHDARVSAMTSALATRVSWDRVFREFSLVLPEDVWITSLTVKAPALGEVAGASNQFSIKGSTYSQDGVARLLSRLQLVPDLTNVLLRSSMSTKVGQQDVVDFDIGADLNTGSTAP